MAHARQKDGPVGWTRLQGIRDEGLERQARVQASWKSCGAGKKGALER